MHKISLNQYVESHTTPETDVLYQLNRATHLQTTAPQMISGHFQGRLLTMLTQMIRPNRVLEIGTFTGYTAICFAMGLPEHGQVHTIEINEELEEMIHEYLDLAKVSHQVTLHMGDAKTIIPTIEEQFDLVFIDASKMEYDTYYELVFSKVVKGGFILSDNVLWDGKVAQPNHLHNKKTASIHAYNQKIQNDPRVENLLLPIRDGIMIARKIV